MNGFVALYVALVSYGNLYLKQGSYAPKLDFNNSTLIYCGKLQFFSDSTSKTLVAKTPDEWFEFLKKGGCQALKIFYWHSDQKQAKDYMMAGFVGSGGNWIVQTIYHNYANYWVSKEDVGDANAKDDRIWNIEFYLTKTKAPILDLTIPAEKEKQSLSASLDNILTFAEKNSSQDWAKTFRNALDNLNSRNPEPAYYKDAFPENQYSLQRRQLLVAASIADVFGGMGSWNDISYPSDDLEKQNAALSSNLFDRINESIVIAVNPPD